MGAIEDVIMGVRQQTSPEAESPFSEGVIRTIEDDGVTFTMPAWDEGRHVFGPAPYPLDMLVMAGDRCLVVFTENGPWVIGVWPA